MSTVKEGDVVGALKWLRELRRWAVLNDVDPWAVREALIMALELDTDAALRRGISREALDRFDLQVKKDVQRFARSL